MDPKPPINFSQPISVLLKNTTKQVHEDVENSPGARALIKGTLSRDGYIKYLFTLWHLYDALESALDEHSLHPTLAPSYNPALLRRCDALSSDISHLLTLSPSSSPEWKKHSLYTSSFLPSLPVPLAEYITRLNDLRRSQDPTPLLAHSYVRYLGDLSGGQCIRRVLKRTYALDDLAMSFYDFQRLRGLTGPSGVGDLRKLKEWFKAAMDEGVGDDMAKKRMIVEEVQLAFRYNGLLLDTLVEASPRPDPIGPSLPRVLPPPTNSDFPGWVWSLNLPVWVLFVPIAMVALSLASFHEYGARMHFPRRGHLVAAIVGSLTTVESF
ncbi:hypothetical protein FRB94_005096 [Tulasnella sp. JGI-2019a]|nr:hypothetical protein FRB94_005096 [Tulasnella sp. JGI-2019a]